MNASFAGARTGKTGHCRQRGAGGRDIFTKRKQKRICHYEKATKANAWYGLSIPDWQGTQKVLRQRLRREKKGRKETACFAGVREISIYYREGKRYNKNMYYMKADEKLANHSAQVLLWKES